MTSTRRCNTLPARRAVAAVHKFGGTSLSDVASIRAAAAVVVRENVSPCYVVVSSARGVTDGLLECLQLAASQDFWAPQLLRLRRHQYRLAKSLCGDHAGCLISAIRADCSQIKASLLEAERFGATSVEATDAIVAYGELWSMRLFSAFLRCIGMRATMLDARDFLRARRSADRIEIDWISSRKGFAAATAKSIADVIVIPGFIATCADRNIPLTLGRNTGDWSAAVIARLAGSEGATIWTDVPGILNADPAVVAEASLEPQMSIDAAYKLAACGAQVLHPATLEPQDGAITKLSIKCTFDAASEGTAIVKDGPLPAAIVVSSDGSVTAFGTTVKPASGVEALANARIPFESAELLPRQIRVKLAPGDAERAQRVWHRCLCRHQRSVNIFLIGTGKVGSALLKILAEQGGNNIRLLGVANSRVTCLKSDGLAPQLAHRSLKAAAKVSDPAIFGEFLLSHCEAAPVIIDATASAQIAEWHRYWLSIGIHVVTANKSALAAGSITASHRERAFYGDAATVGAGLPILSTIRRLRSAGDIIVQLEGVLSGSLAYIFHALQQGCSFSSALDAARRAGYMEPDPCIDLSGEDVGCKLAIMAMAAGIDAKINSSEPILATNPGHSIDIFRRDLEAIDAALRQKAQAAHVQKGVLRYVARLSAEGTSEVGIRMVSRGQPLAQTQGVENVVVIHSKTYAEQPLVVRGPGAGPLVTARSLLGDIRIILERYG